MAQKIIKVGSSAAITVSPDGLEVVQLNVGDRVHVSFHAASRTITIRPQEKRAMVGPDVITWTNAFIEKNRRLLKHLADK